MTHTLNDLNNSLFAQLQRLEEANIEGEGLNAEIAKAQAINGIAMTVIANGNLVLQAQRFAAETYGRTKTEMPKMLEG